jgi:hypothetical protein
MKLSGLRRDLAKAEIHVRDGARQVAHQQAIVAELESHGHDTGRARELLTSLQEMQVTHQADRDRIAREIEDEENVPRRSIGH